MNAENLNSAMDFDHVIGISNGEVRDAPSSIYAPEVIISVDDDGQILPGAEQELRKSVEQDQGWELLSGWTGQMGGGWIMHPSEFVGGRLAEHILENDGLYCVVTVETDDDSEDAAGWAVAYREWAWSFDVAEWLDSLGPIGDTAREQARKGFNAGYAWASADDLGTATESEEDAYSAGEGYWTNGFDAGKEVYQSEQYEDGLINY